MGSLPSYPGHLKYPTVIQLTKTKTHSIAGPRRRSAAYEVCRNQVVWVALDLATLNGLCEPGVKQECDDKNDESDDQHTIAKTTLYVLKCGDTIMRIIRPLEAPNVLTVTLFSSMP